VWGEGFAVKHTCNLEKKNFVRGEKLFAAQDGVNTRRG
jgi:hypothetical protein